MPADVGQIASNTSLSQRVTDILAGQGTWGDFGFLALALLVSVVYFFFIYRFVSSSRYRETVFKPYRVFITRFFGIQVESTIDRESGVFEKLNDAISNLEHKQINISEVSENKIVSYFEKALGEGFGDEFRKSIKDFARKEIIDFKNEEALFRLAAARGRLQSAMSSVSTRGVASLVIGIIVAGGAFAILRDMIGSIDLAKGIQSGSSQEFNLMIYLALVRFSTVVFTTFIAYFFLSLYRRSLDEVKYYQAELTNVDSWMSAVGSASATADPKIIAYVIAKLLETDRNFSTQTQIGGASSSSDNLKISSDIIKSILDKVPAGN